VLPFHGKFVLVAKGSSARVFSHAQIVKDQANIEHELSHFLRDAAYPFGFYDTNGKAAQAGDIFRAMSGTYPAAVFVIVPIDNVMTAVFDAPVAAIGGKHAFGVSLLRGPAGNAIGKFTGVFTGFFICELALDDKSLSDVRKVQIVVEFRCGPDFTDFDTAMIGRIAEDKVRLLAVVKI
jgi:hypothetical protein